MRKVLTAEMKQVTIVHGASRPMSVYEQLRRQAHAAEGQNVSLTERLIAEIEQLHSRVAALESKLYRTEMSFDR